MIVILEATDYNERLVAHLHSFNESSLRKRRNGTDVVASVNDMTFMCPDCCSTVDQAVLQIDRGEYVAWCPCGVVYAGEATQTRNGQVLRYFEEK